LADFLCHDHGRPDPGLAACGCRKFQVDVLGDHLCTCTTHSGAKKAHDWAVDQLADLFRTTHKVKTVQVAKSRGRNFGDIELVAYLVNTTLGENRAAFSSQLKNRVGLTLAKAAALRH
jgi:hypothetical protein